MTAAPLSATRPAYERCWADWEAWCTSRGSVPLPATPEHLIGWLTEVATRYRAGGRRADPKLALRGSPGTLGATRRLRTAKRREFRALGRPEAVARLLGKSRADELLGCCEAAATSTLSGIGPTGRFGQRLSESVGEGAVRVVCLQCRECPWHAREIVRHPVPATWPATRACRTCPEAPSTASISLRLRSRYASNCSASTLRSRPRRLGLHHLDILRNMAGLSGAPGNRGNPCRNPRSVACFVCGKSQVRPVGRVVGPLVASIGWAGREKRRPHLRMPRRDGDDCRFVFLRCPHGLRHHRPRRRISPSGGRCYGPLAKAS